MERDYQKLFEDRDLELRMALNWASVVMLSTHGILDYERRVGVDGNNVIIDMHSWDEMMLALRGIREMCAFVISNIPQ